MLLYPIALFLHTIGVITLFGAIVLIQNVGVRLRAATSREHAGMLLALVLPTRGMFGFATGMILVTGLYMAWNRWSLKAPWVNVALGAVVLMGVFGAMVQRTFMRLAREAGEGAGPLPEPLRMELRNPKLWSIIFALNGGAIGLLWLMARKPGWIESVAVVAGFVVLLSVVGRAVAGAQARAAVTPRAHPGRS